MSKTIPPFRVTIVGESAEEVRIRMREFLGAENKIEHAPTPTLQVETLTRAAPQVELPKVEAELRREISPSVQHVSPPSIPTATIPKVSGTAASVPIANDYGVDTKGLPWDERIHAVTQAKLKDGSWRYKRGVEDHQIRAVEQELVEKVKGQQASVMESHPPISHPVPPAAAIPFPNAAPVVPQVLPPAPVLAVAPPLPPPQPALPSAHTLVTFKTHLVPTLAKLVADKKLTQDYVNSLAQHFGVDQIWKVNDQHLSEMFDQFVQYGLIAKV